MNIHFAALDKLFYIPLFVVLAIFIVMNVVRIARSYHLLTHALQTRRMFRHFSMPKQYIKAFLLLLGLVFLLIAWCQPQWGNVEQAVVQEGRDVLILLDVSRSMLAQDISPSRMELAKLKILNVLDGLKSDRLGLILFSSSAFVQCPFTSDRSAFLMHLNNTDVYPSVSSSTCIDVALERAMELFGVNPDRKHKLVVLVTDGEDFSTQFESVEKKVAELGVKVCILGMGTPQGAPVPKFDRAENRIGCETDEQGNVILTKLNEPFLQEVAKKCNGLYVRSTENDSDYQAIIGWVNRFEKEKIDDKKVALFQDQYYWFLGIAWMLLALEWML